MASPVSAAEALMARMLGGCPWAQGAPPASVVVAQRSMVSGPSTPFLILAVATCAGRKSATAAAITNTSAVGACLDTASARLLAELTCTTSTPRRDRQPLRRMPSDQSNVGAALGGHPRHRIALLAGLRLPTKTHRIDRLACATGSNQQLSPRGNVGRGVVPLQQQLGERW